MKGNMNRYSVPITQPYLAAALMSMIPALTVMLMMLLREFDGRIQIVFVISFLILVLGWSAFSIWIATRPVQLELYEDRIIWGKKEYGKGSISRIQFDQKRNAVTLYQGNKIRLMGNLKDRNQAQEVIAQLSSWCECNHTSFLLK
jgi:hypothetical protein